MEDFFHFEGVAPHGGFTTAWLSNQPFGEVDPKFYMEFIDELEDTWKVMDYNHTVILGYTSHFCVRLANDIINNPYMNIFCLFEDYVRQRKIEYMNICCANGNTWNFQVATTDHPLKTTSIGPQWDEFYKQNGFAEGDAITFKFGDLYPSTIVHVYKGLP
ncbi:hypothetical protein P8452_41829 [Trifolium repens]|nr:hypothetical protein P8452_41829 [Trifolium repens]